MRGRKLAAADNCEWECRSLPAGRAEHSADAKMCAVPIISISRALRCRRGGRGRARARPPTHTHARTATHLSLQLLLLRPGTSCATAAQARSPNFLTEARR